MVSTAIPTQSDREVAQRIRTLALALVLASLIVACLYAVVRSRNWPLVEDSALMHFVSWRILAGDTPYREILDINMPGTHLIHMAVITLLGRGDGAFRVFDLLWLGLTALLIVFFVLPFGRWTAAFAASFFVAFHIGSGPELAGERDYLIGTLALLAACLLAQYFERAQTRPYHYLFLAGLAIGFAATIKPLPVLLLVLFLALYTWTTHSSRREWLAGSAALIGGAALVPLAIGIWFALAGALAEFVDIQISYALPFYSPLDRKNSLVILLALALDPTIGVIILNAIPLSILYFRHTKHVQSNPRLLILLAGLLYGLAHLLIQGKGWLYHLYPFCLFLIVLTAVLLLDAIGRDTQRVRVPLFLSLVLLSGLLGLRAVRMGRADNSLQQVQPLAAELTRDLSGYRLAKTDTVQTIDNNDGGVNALYRLQLRQPTRFIYDNQFFSYLDQPYIQGLRSEFIQVLEHNPPRLIVVFDYSEMPHLGPERLALFPDLAALLRNEYRVDKVRDGYTIYARKPGASG